MLFSDFCKIGSKIGTYFQVFDGLWNIYSLDSCFTPKLVDENPLLLKVRKLKIVDESDLYGISYFGLSQWLPLNRRSLWKQNLIPGEINLWWKI